MDYEKQRAFANTISPFVEANVASLRIAQHIGVCTGSFRGIYSAVRNMLRGTLLSLLFGMAGSVHGIFNSFARSSWSVDGVAKICSGNYHFAYLVGV